MKYTAHGVLIMAMVQKARVILYPNLRERESGLKKLRMGKARRMLLENFEIVEAKAYKNSVGQFKQHGCSSVEYIAIRKAEIEAEYEKRIRQIKAMAVS